MPDSPWDIITEVNNQPVSTVKQYRDAVRGAGAKPVLLQLVSEGVPGFKILKDRGD